MITTSLGTFKAFGPGHNDIYIVVPSNSLDIKYNPIFLTDFYTGKFKKYRTYKEGIVDAVRFFIRIQDGKSKTYNKHMSVKEYCSKFCPDEGYCNKFCDTSGYKPSDTIKDLNLFKLLLTHIRLERGKETVEFLVKMGKSPSAQESSQYCYVKSI